MFIDLMWIKLNDNSTEKEKRFKIFQKNLKKIDLMNRNERGTAEYGINKFADLTGLSTRHQSLK